MAHRHHFPLRRPALTALEQRFAPRLKARHLQNGLAMLQPNDHLLFFGDSITDCGRNRSAPLGDPSGLGTGYVPQIAARLMAAPPVPGLAFTNRGVSGDRIYDLEERLERDVLALAPDVVTILIGINDVWRRFDSGVESPPDEFLASYRAVLERLTGLGPQLVLMEPFVLPVPPDRATWREDLNAKIEIVRALAGEFETLLVPLDVIFTRAARQRPAAFWAADGVHPSPAGHALIADSWLEIVA